MGFTFFSMTYCLILVRCSGAMTTVAPALGAVVVTVVDCANAGVARSNTATLARRTRFIEVSLSEFGASRRTKITEAPNEWFRWRWSRFGGHGSGSPPLENRFRTSGRPIIVA